jgi:hypothetical protein
MSTPSIETGIRAHLLARTWTWIVSVVLTLSAIAAGYGGGSALCHWGGGTELPGFKPPPIPLFGSSLTLDSYVAMTSSILVWTVAWALHFHASRRRRMSIFHVIVPMAIFLPWLIVALRTAPTCTSL